MFFSSNTWKDDITSGSALFIFGDNMAAYGTVLHNFSILASQNQESLRRDGVTLIVNKSPKCGTWMESQNNRMISVCFQGKPFSITVIQVYAPTSNAEEAEVERF